MLDSLFVIYWLCCFNRFKVDLVGLDGAQCARAVDLA